LLKIHLNITGKKKASFYFQKQEWVWLCFYLLTLEQSPSWDANSHSASQEVSCFLWNQEVHYCVHKTPTLILIVNQMHTIHSFPPYFPKGSNIIFPFIPRSSKQSLPIRFYDQNFVWIFHFSHACYIPFTSHPPWFDHQNNISWSIQAMKLQIMQSFPSSCYFLPLRSEYSPQHSVLKHPQSFFP